MVFPPFGILEGDFSSLNCRIMTAETKFTSPSPVTEISSRSLHLLKPWNITC